MDTLVSPRRREHRLPAVEFAVATWTPGLIGPEPGARVAQLGSIIAAISPFSLFTDVGQSSRTVGIYRAVCA